MKKILLIGKDGQIGWELQRSLATLGEVAALSRKDLDLSDLNSIRAIIPSFHADIIVNAAAYTNVDLAEKEQEKAFLINAQAAEILAEEAKKQNSLFVHYSTDYVFNGNAIQPYTENQDTQPLNVYGASKLAGEKAIQSIGGKYLIFRTAWIYGTRKKSFLSAILELAKQNKPLNIVSDQIGSPTWCRHVADATAQILAMKYESPWGVYHMTCAGEASRYEFAKACPQLRNTVIQSILSKDYVTAAKRPKYSVLDNQKLYDVFGLKLPHWKSSLVLSLETELKNNRHGKDIKDKGFG